MKIQISRNSRQKSKYYSSVCHQQGRMLTDSDLTEQAFISRDRLSDALTNVIGSGTPRQGGLVRIGGDGSPGLYWGRVYVDGVPAAVVPDGTAAGSDLFDYAHQLFYPQAPDLPEGDFRFYLDVWERSVSWLEDEMLRDPGLHGADTTARTQTIAQVKWCARDLDPLCTDVNPTMGNARLRLVLRSLATGVDPCDPCADELELDEPVGNYLFRVEIHDVHYDGKNRPDWVVLKWSSENGGEAYKAADVPPDFSSSQHVYEFFDDVTETRLGNHLARDASGNRIIDGCRQEMENDFSATSAAAKAYVRRWDGWCEILRSGDDWQVSQGVEGSIDLSNDIGSGQPGHVIQGGDAVTIELRMITLALELADLDMVAGDYWMVPVRESVHQSGEVLLEGDVPGTGALPEGEVHHYMALVDVLDEKTMTLVAGSACDEYKACQPMEFPSLTDLRADDICFDNQICSMPDAQTVQEALDYLCHKNELPWHNKYLHGWGVVCGLALECHRKKRDSVLLLPGYALDCEGRDLILRQSMDINIPELMKKAGIKPEDADGDEDRGLCLYIETTEEKDFEVGIETYQPEDQGWSDMFSDSLLLDFYQDCVLDLVKVFNFEMDGDDEVMARCALTECGEKILPPARRRVLAFANLVFNDAADTTAKTVLNVSFCEHALLRDLYIRLQDHLRSKTFCAQFDQTAFPDYPFKQKTVCRGTWFTPENLDHIRLHPNGRILFGWQRSSNRIFVFRLLKPNCMGDLIGFTDLPKIEDGTITDLAISDKGMILVSVIVHQENTLLMRSQFDEPEGEGCEIKLDWETCFVGGRKLTNVEHSPWSGRHIYAVALCEGVFLFDLEKVFKDKKVGRLPDWKFPASGHIRFDRLSNQVLATAWKEEKDKVKSRSLACAKGHYNAMAVFDGKPGGDPSLLNMLPLYVNDYPVSGSDGFDLSSASQVSPDDDGSRTMRLMVTDLQTYVVINENDQKVLCRFGRDGIEYNEDKDRIWMGEKRHSFGPAKKVGLKYISSAKLEGVVASRFAMHDLQYIPADPKKMKKELLDSMPVQAGPVEILTHEDSEHLYILNHTGQSVTLFNYGLPVYQKEAKVLVAYREKVTEAFLQLVSGIAQYLKDCFCHHLLIRCPECHDEDKVYLGCLSMEDDKVFKICNFTKRKYVKTFPGVSYWFSILPVEGLITWLVEKICCLVIPDFINEKPNATLAVGPAAMSMTKSALHANPALFASVISSRGGEVAKKQVANAIGLGLSNQTGLKDGLKNEYNYKPGVFYEEKIPVLSNEKLYEKVEALDQKEASTTKVVLTLKDEMEKLQSEKAMVEVRFTEMETAKLASEAKVSELEKKLAAVKADAKTSNQRVAELEKGVAAYETLQNEMKPVIAGAKPVSSLTGISKANLQLLEQNNIWTVGTLASMKSERLVDLGVNSRTAASMIKKATDRIVI